MSMASPACPLARILLLPLQAQLGRRSSDFATFGGIKHPTTRQRNPRHGQDAELFALVQRAFVNWFGMQELELYLIGYRKAGQVRAQQCEL